MYWTIKTYGKKNVGQRPPPVSGFFKRIIMCIGQLDRKKFPASGWVVVEWEGVGGESSRE